MTKNTPEEIHSSLTRERAEALFVSRQDMLASLREDIEPYFSEALGIKIGYEHTYLLELIASDAEAMTVRRKANTTLNANYFTHKPLDTRHFLTI